MVTYTVTGKQRIHCAGCEERIANALRRLPGIRDVQASHETQRVAVRFDPAHITLGQVQARLEVLGYRVQAGSDRESAKFPSGEAGTRDAARERSAP
jgi:copper chaperone CopZ